MPLNQIKKLSEVFIKKIDKIEIDANKCVRVRSVLSQCQACQTVCPIDSIEISNERLMLPSTCLECGLCTAVCPTNALRWNNPPLLQLYYRWMNQSGQKFVITCDPMLKSYRDTSVETVPCLGLVPAELWLALGQRFSEIQLVCTPESCASCEVTTGFAQLKKALTEAHLPEGLVYFSQSVQNQEREIDYDRRRLLSGWFEEMKETHTIAVKEMLEVQPAMTPFEKFERYVRERDQLEEMAEEVNAIKLSVIDRLLQDTLIYTDKRQILLDVLKQHEKHNTTVEVQLPKVTKDCTLCKACAFLCPTEALYIDEDSFILAPSKCVACHLCEEICWDKHITLQTYPAKILQKKYIFLHQQPNV